MTDRLRKQLAFILELDQEKNILRQTHLSNHGRRENDAEHAWHMAIMAYLLQEYSNAPIDVAKVMLMCLLHDVVEIDAGDTYAYDEKERNAKAREEAAKNGFMGCFRKIKRNVSSSFLRSLKHGKRQNQNLHMPWITCSRCCSMTATTAVIGKHIG